MASGQDMDNVDEQIASLAFGWCLAIFVLARCRLACSWAAAHKYTRIYWYFCLCTALVLTSGTLAVFSWTYLINRFRPGLVEFGAFLFLWSLQAHIYFQIIINRICILEPQWHRQMMLRVGTLISILVVNAFMISFWLLQVLHGFETTSSSTMSMMFWMPRIEKLVYLSLDILLNWLFIHQIRTKLMSVGLLKYRRLIQYNLRIISLSLICDALLLGMQWYPHNNALFIIIHPVLFLNKLILEISICERMAAVSKEASVLQTIETNVSREDEYAFPEKMGHDESMEEKCGDLAISVESVEAVEDGKKLPRIPVTAALLSPVIYLGSPTSGKTQLSYYAVSV